MKKRSGEALGAILAIALLGVIGFFTLSEPSITGYAIYSDGCDSTIASSGYWELNDSLSCATNNVITVNVSNVTFDCQSFPITGNYDSGASAFVFASDLTNVSITNCNITAFTDPITVGANTNISISNSYVALNESCVTGDWADEGMNSGCLNTTNTPDVTAPNITVTNQTTYTNVSFSYQIDATDNSTIDSYYINHESTAEFQNGTTNFSVSTSGLITNTTIMNVSNYTFIVNATDEFNNSNSESFMLMVLTGTKAPAQNNDDDDDDDDDDSSSSSSSGGGGSAGSTNICGESAAWICDSWSDCVESEQKRLCTRKNQDCTDPLPEVVRACDTDQGASNTAIEATATIEPNTAEVVEETPEQGVVITGGAVTAFESFTQSLKSLKNTGMIAGAVLVLIIGFVLTLMLGRKTKKRKLQNSIAKTDSFGGFVTQLLGKKEGDEQSKKLWDWEEKKMRSPTKQMNKIPDETKKLWDWEEKHK